MPSLFDMFQPQNAAGEPVGFGDALASRSNSLIGLGLGMLQPSRPLSGESTYGNMLQGYMGGAGLDARTAAEAARLRHQKQQDARQAAMDKFNMSLREREFARGNITDAQRAMGDVLGPNATPEQKADFMKNYYASKTDPGGWILKDIIDPNDPDGERKITVQEHNRTGQIRPPVLPGQTGTAAAPAIDWTPGATTNAPVYGAGGVDTFSRPSVAAPAAPAAGGGGAPRSVTMPNGEVLTPPPGLSKDGRKAWTTHIAQTAADMSSGKMTEAQAKYSIYAKGMEIAQRELQGLEGPGTSPGTSAEGKGLGSLPWGVGAWFQSNQYQNYRNAKDAWLNAKLRAESGATINPDEFARDDRIYFPQPGEGPEQVAAKKLLREHITKNMTRAGGPGYTPLGAPAAPAAAGGQAPAAGGGGTPPPPAGFTIVRP
jgi:hypothetical protein